MPLATATAAPPLEPPEERPASHALWVRPEQGRVGQALAAELRRRGFADQDRALAAQPRHRHGVLVRHIVLVGNGAEGGPEALGVDDVLDGDGDAVEQAERLAGHHLALGFARRCNRLITAEGDETVERGLERLGARENGADDLDWRNPLSGDEAAQLGCGQATGIAVHGHIALRSGPPLARRH